MFFNSFEYIFIFLPMVWAGYFILNRYRGISAGRPWLLVCCLFFYGYFNIAYLALLLLSIGANYGIGMLLQDGELQRQSRKVLLTTGLVFNITLLGFFKYVDFFITNINTASGSHLSLLNIALPVGISFFTFQQISFLVDSYRGKMRERNFLQYMLYVSFFPSIVSGPITRHHEIMPQYSDEKNWHVDYRNVASGIILFAMGLFKKGILADHLALWVNQGFDTAIKLNLLEAWVTSLCYTLQIYFDFSGYTDMAIGTALLFNLKLPLNFDSPYRSLSIQEFWRRWHITLSKFLRDYIYIPLGGNRVGHLYVYMNIFITFLVGGIWHGAGWTFLLWGMAHGVAMIIHRMWCRTGIRLNRFVSWFITFNFLNAAWVLFRARDLHNAVKVYRGMLGLDGVVLSEKFSQLTFLKSLGVEFTKWPVNIPANLFYLLYMLAASLVLSLFWWNTKDMAEKFKPDWKWLLLVSIVLGVGLIHISRISNFIYAVF
jgi:alginate O-acetyltransferase complex protein AlgI